MRATSRVGLKCIQMADSLCLALAMAEGREKYEALTRVSQGASSLRLRFNEPRSDFVRLVEDMGRTIVREVHLVFALFSSVCSDFHGRTTQFANEGRWRNRRFGLERDCRFN